MNETGQRHSPITAFLVEAIEGGRLGEGDLLPSESELAQQFGVDRNWVRRALREVETEGYILRSQGRRSVVAPMSNRRHVLTLGKLPTLAVAIPGYMDVFDRSIVDGFMRFASSHELNGQMFSAALDEEEEEAFLLKAPETGIAGLAVWLQHDTPGIADALDSLRRRRFPVVQIDRYLNGSETDYVVTDNEAVGFALAEMVLDRGHTRIGFASVFENVSSVRDRFAGFRRALASRSVPFNGQYHTRIASFDIYTVHVAVAELMSRRESPTALVCTHDEMAHRIIKELLSLGYDIPAHVDIATLDDLGQSRSLGVPLLTVRQNPQEMGRTAAEMLLERIGNPDLPPRHIKLPVAREPYDE